VKFLDCNNGNVYCEFQDPAETCFSALAVTNLANTAGEEVLVCAAAGSLGLLRLIDLTRGVWYADKDILPTAVRALAFHPKHPRWLLSGGEDTKISLWELDAPPASDPMPVSSGYAQFSRPVLFLRSHVLAVYPASMRLLAVFQDALPIWCLSWCPDGEMFVAGSQGSLRCWHIRNLGATSNQVDLRTKSSGSIYWQSLDVPPPIQSVFFMGPDLLLARGSTNRSAKLLTAPREASEPELCLTLDVRSSEFRRAETLQAGGTGCVTRQLLTLSLQVGSPILWG
jgi:WD40 repeat protein